MTTITLPGYFSDDQAKIIKTRLQGHTYYDFQIEYGGRARNNVIIVSTKSDISEDDLRSMFYFCALNMLTAPDIQGH